MRIVSKFDLDLIIKMRKQGKTAEQIANYFGITKRAVQGRIYRMTKGGIFFLKKCLHCNKVFKTKNINKKYCSVLHTKRANRKRQRSKITCLLPECNNKFLGIKGTNKFCCRKHGDLHSKRIATGVYERIIKNKYKCLACNETVILDEHHIEIVKLDGKSRSNKKSKTVYLCPTHHLAIHRGYAKIDKKGKYIFLIEDIRKGLNKIGNNWREVH